MQVGPHAITRTVMVSKLPDTFVSREVLVIAADAEAFLHLYSSSPDRQYVK
jgi:hypothetical protein